MDSMTTTQMISVMEVMFELDIFEYQVDRKYKRLMGDIKCWDMFNRVESVCGVEITELSELIECANELQQSTEDQREIVKEEVKKVEKYSGTGFSKHFFIFHKKRGQASPI